MVAFTKYSIKYIFYHSAAEFSNLTGRKVLVLIYYMNEPLTITPRQITGLCFIYTVYIVLSS